MGNRFVKISALVFLALVMAAAFPWLREKMSGAKDNEKSGISVNLKGFSKENVGKIILKKEDSEKILSFRENKWLIGDKEADEDKINQLFKDFSDLKIKEMVSEKQENWEKFEVTKDKGFQLIITQKGKDSLFFIGKTGSSADDFYMRKEGIKNVYLVSGKLRDKLGWEADKWEKTTKDEK